MATEALFTAALGLQEPWHVVATNFEAQTQRLTIHIDFARSSRFEDPETKQLCPVHDTVLKEWEHLKFFQHRTVLKARVPRIKTPSGKVRQIQVPWAHPRSGFTLLFEAFLLTLAKAMPVLEVSRQTGVSDDRIWHLLRSRVDQAWRDEDWSSVKRLGVDETSTKKGHHYATAFLEISGTETKRGVGGSTVSRLLYFTPGKGKETITSFCQELEGRGLKYEQIKEVAMDMSPAFIAGASQQFPGATLCFDRFHVMKLCGSACDEVRKKVTREQGKLPKGAMWALRGNAARLKTEARELRESLCKQYREIGRAQALGEYLSDLWNYQSRELAEEHFKGVLAWCQRSRLEPLVRLGRTLRKHREGILGYYENYTTSAAIEAINGLLQLAKRRARGYRRFENFQAMAYWIAGKLDLTPKSLATH